MAIVLGQSVPSSQQAMVREYSYTMDGVDMGTLYLLDSRQNARQVCWYSNRTGLKTPWHGEWFCPTGLPEQRLVFRFDFRGRVDKARFKFVDVEYNNLLNEFRGIDYRSRFIQMRMTRTWTFDPERAWTFDALD